MAVKIENIKSRGLTSNKYSSTILGRDIKLTDKCIYLKNKTKFRRQPLFLFLTLLYLVLSKIAKNAPDAPCRAENRQTSLTDFLRFLKIFFNTCQH